MFITRSKLALRKISNMFSVLEFLIFDLLLYFYFQFCCCFVLFFSKLNFIGRMMTFSFALWFFCKTYHNSKNSMFLFSATYFIRQYIIYAAL